MTPNRYPEDRTILTYKEVHDQLKNQRNNILTLLEYMSDIMDTTPINAHRRALLAFEIISKNNLWEAATPQVGLLPRDIRSTYSIFLNHNKQDKKPVDLYPKLQNIIFSDRARCNQLEPTANMFLTDLYIGIRRLSAFIALILSRNSKPDYAPYQYSSFMIKLCAKKIDHPSPLLNPILSEQYYNLLQNNKENYKRVVAIMRMYGSTPYLISLNTYKECSDYAKSLNQEIDLLDKESIKHEWAIMSKVNYRDWKATTNFGDFLTRQRHYLEIPLRKIQIQPQPDKNSFDEINLTEIMSIYENTHKLKSNILDVCGIFRAYALLQTTYQRYISVAAPQKTNYNDSLFSPL